MDTRLWHEKQFTVTDSVFRRTSARDIELVNAGAQVIGSGSRRHFPGKRSRVPGGIDKLHGLGEPFSRAQ